MDNETLVMLEKQCRDEAERLSRKANYYKMQRLQRDAYRMDRLASEAIKTAEAAGGEEPVQTPP